LSSITFRRTTHPPSTTYKVPPCLSAYPCPTRSLPAIAESDRWANTIDTLSDLEALCPGSLDRIRHWFMKGKEGEIWAYDPSTATPLFPRSMEDAEMNPSGLFHGRKYCMQVLARSFTSWQSVISTHHPGHSSKSGADLLSKIQIAPPLPLRRLSGLGLEGNDMESVDETGGGAGEGGLRIKVNEEDEEDEGSSDGEGEDMPPVVWLLWVPPPDKLDKESVARDEAILASSSESARTIIRAEG